MSVSTDPGRQDTYPLKKLDADHLEFSYQSVVYSSNGRAGMETKKRAYARRASSLASLPIPLPVSVTELEGVWKGPVQNSGMGGSPHPVFHGAKACIASVLTFMEPCTWRPFTFAGGTLTLSGQSGTEKWQIVKNPSDGRLIITFGPVTLPSGNIAPAYASIFAKTAIEPNLSGY